MTETPVPAPLEFLETKEYHRFAECCDACGRYRYIGVCHGPPGVGKTLSARHYARWEELEPQLRAQRLHLAAPEPGPELLPCRTLLYTPTVTTTPRQLAEELETLRWNLNSVVLRATPPPPEGGMQIITTIPELVVVDEADRLKFPTLEQLRDSYDRVGFGLVLIGMPGLEKRLVRYPQLYSRVGFVHQYRTLSAEEMRFILAHQWRQLGLTFAPEEFTDAEAMAAIIRITAGNFRLVHRLFAQIERILRLNELQTISKEVVEAAREGLVIGTV